MFRNLVDQTLGDENRTFFTLPHFKIESSQNLEDENRKNFTLPHLEFKLSKWKPFTYFQDTTLQYLAFNTSKKPCKLSDDIPNTSNVSCTVEENSFPNCFLWVFFLFYCFGVLYDFSYAVNNGVITIQLFQKSPWNNAIVIFQLIRQKLSSEVPKSYNIQFKITGYITVLLNAQYCISLNFIWWLVNLIIQVAKYACQI